ncbi:MAG: hypothetical protein KDJ77_17480, partial [Rhodobiaceae bacterium]|nr:hypothetical protein [Rhodobiaceae bacterium]
MFKCGNRRVAIETHAADPRIGRRRIVEQDPRRRRQHGAVGDRIRGADRITHDHLLIGRQQAVRVDRARYLAGLGIDRLEQPDCGVRGEVDAHRCAQYEAIAGAQIEIALIEGPVFGHVDGNVAKRDIAETEAASVESVVERGDDANFLRRPADNIFLFVADGEGETDIVRHPIVRSITGRRVQDCRP